MNVFKLKPKIYFTPNLTDGELMKEIHSNWLY